MTEAVTIVTVVIQPYRRQVIISPSVSMVTEFAAALANPIAYQSALEKHAQQLAVLEQEEAENNQYGVEEVRYTLLAVTAVRVTHCVLHGLLLLPVTSLMS